MHTRQLENQFQQTRDTMLQKFSAIQMLLLRNLGNIIYFFFTQIKILCEIDMIPVKEKKEIDIIIL